MSENGESPGSRCHNRCMTIDGDAAYQVLIAHDARFDGRLFVGVTSTGVYCRPICRVRMPARRNCRFFASPAQAEAASFRPCLKCRPEIAPGPGLAWTVMDARARSRARRRARSTPGGDGEAPQLAEIAARLGVSDRHLRRIFVAEHGVTPLQYLQTRRLLLAKQFLTDTQMPVAQVALTSGFRSLRRFNAAFADSYRMNPTRLRARARPSGDHRAPRDRARRRITVTLAYRAPYDVRRTAALRRAARDPRHRGRGPSIRRSVRAGVAARRRAGSKRRFVPERRASASLRARARTGERRRHRRRAALARPRRRAGDDRPQTLVGLPGERASACRAASTPSSSAVRCSASRSRSRRRGRSPPPRRELRRRIRDAMADVMARFPRPSTGCRGRAAGSREPGIIGAGAARSGAGARGRGSPRC